MKAVLTLTTDFGLTDPFVGIMKGVLAARAPDALVIDVTHGIPPQDVRAGALVLRHAVPYFPAGAIHVAVVDPGVGGPRRPLCIETAAGLFVGPDNGLLSLAAPRNATRRIVHLTDERRFLSPRSATFHGRDVFAPVAAALAAGVDPSALGDPLEDIVRLPEPAAIIEGRSIRGEVMYADHYGNLVTSISEAALAAFPRDRLSITLRGRRVQGLATTYAAVAPGTLLAVVGSWGLVEIAVRDGSAKAVVGGAVGDAVVIRDETT